MRSAASWLKRHSGKGEAWMRKKKRVQRAELPFDIVNYTLLALFSFAMLYPFVYTFSMSISSPVYAVQNVIVLLPKGFSLESYKLVFRDSEIWRSYYNTLWYTGVGTSINVFLTVLSAYPLSKKQYFLRNTLMIFVAFTMFFSGGLIPSFILVTQLGLYNTRWAIILPGAISAWNLILARTFFESIPESMDEAAVIDGASQLRILTRIYLPLSMPIIAVLVLFYAVGHWNSYFSALLYLPDKTLQPMQLYLRKVLTMANNEIIGSQMAIGYERSLATMQLKYTVVIVTILPIICVYPFLQKYFVKGVMIGAIKG
jgi:putative aldouronate transport system permease protein